MSYDSHSADAMFSRIEMRLDTQDNTLQEILREVKKTNGRVTRLETEWAVSKGKIAAISGVVSCIVGIAGWIITGFIKK